MATLVKQLREGHKNTIFVAAGDLIGASPFLSAMFHDEPTIESLSMMGLEIASVGNHEFDEGKDELLRMQNGGCHPDDGCQGPHPFTGAKFRYLAASTIEKSTGKTVFPPYEIREFDGIPVAFIGLTLKGTPLIVAPVGIAGLEFRDEAETVNALVPELKARGVEAIVVLIHEGGFRPATTTNAPASPARSSTSSRNSTRRSTSWSPATPTAPMSARSTAGSSLRRQIRHARHRDRPQARSRHARHRQRQGRQHHRSHGTLAKDAEQTALIDAYDRLAAPIASRPAGSVTETLSRMPNAAGESPLGDIIADAQLAATARRRTAAR